MAAPTPNIEAMPVVHDIKDFDLNSGIWLERAIFNNRLWVMLACLAVTLFLGYKAVHISLNASYERMLPYKHPYIQNFAANAKQLRGLGNTLRVVVENTQGDIYDPAFLDTLRKVNDELFLTPGVDRAWVKSIWMPVVRYNEVTEEGFAGGPVMPDTYDGSAASIEKLKQKITNPLTFNVAVHYGCHFSRPTKIKHLDDPERPHILDELVEWTGAKSLPYADKNMCCGAGGGVRSRDGKFALSFTETKLKNMKAVKAQFIIDVCPFCHLQFDRGQKDLPGYDIPVIHLAQLYGLAMGLPKSSLGLEAHEIKVNL